MKRAELELMWSSKHREGNAIPVPKLTTVEATGDPGAREGVGRLIRADNRTAMRALLPALRGQVDLAYLDPPFGTGATFSLTPRGGAAKVTAYDDRWAGGLGDYLSTMLEQLELLRALLSERGTVFVHCDWHVSHYMRCLLDEVFGVDAFKNEIVWRYRRWPAKTKVFQRMHDVIFWYGKSPDDLHAWTPLYEPLAASTLQTFGTKRQVADFSSGHRKPSQTNEETPGAPMSDVWDVGIIAPISHERVGYPTQKPEALLRRVLEAASRPGDLVADFFAGSGTTLAVAQKLGRRWVGCDIGPAAIHASRKRLLELGAAFDVLEVEGASDHAVDAPAAEVLPEATSPRGVRLHLEENAEVDAWAVDWEHNGQVFQTGWHASRKGKKHSMPLAADHVYQRADRFRIAVRIAGASGGERQWETTWKTK